MNCNRMKRKIEGNKKKGLNTNYANFLLTTKANSKPAQWISHLRSYPKEYKDNSQMKF
jgi:hypothetical protein